MPETAGVEAGTGYVFELPSLGADMETGTVLEWFVQPGDTVGRGDVVALVSTEKADIEVEIWRAGRVDGYLVDVGVAVPVGTPLLRLAPGGAPPIPAPGPAAAPAPATAPRPAPAPTPAPPPATAPPPTPAPVPTGVPAAVPAPVDLAPGAPDRSLRPLSSPLARTLAAERGVDLALVTGSGPGGAIVARDLDTATRSAAPPSASTTATDPGTAMRRAIATRMEKANRDIPHYHLDLDVELSGTLAWLQAHNRDRPIEERVLPAALLLQAVARAAVVVPDLNGHWLDGAFRPAPAVDLGVVVSLRRGGLLTPTITGADGLDLDAVMASLRAMVAGARTGAMRSSWMHEASLTVTNLGDNGADRVGGVIFPPQVALVGFGRIRPRPWIVDDTVVARPVVTVTLAADHRASDGATGSRFLTALAQALARHDPEPAPVDDPVDDPAHPNRPRSAHDHPVP